MSLFFRNGKCSIKTALDATTYNLTLDDYIYVAFKGQNVVLPSASACIGHAYLIKLGSNHNGSADNVTVSVSGGGLIEGASQRVINTNYGFYKFISGKNSAGATTWLIVG